jgi:hypothetical protein
VPKIFVRENGKTREVSREEWNLKFPGMELVEPDPEWNDRLEVFDGNITSNLWNMADAACLAEAIWHPDQLDIKKASDLVPFLELGLTELQADRAKFEAMNPANGWGTYDSLCEFVLSYLAACRQYPGAIVVACS